MRRYQLIITLIVVGVILTIPTHINAAMTIVGIITTIIIAGIIPTVIGATTHLAEDRSAQGVVHPVAGAHLVVAVVVHAGAEINLLSLNKSL